jgi:ABC-type multidrug transport system ATPase subunit
VLDHLQALHAAGKTMVISSHHMEDIAELAEAVTALAHGKDQLSGSTADIFHQVEQITQLGLEAPLVSQAAAVLRARGWPLRESILRPAELAEELGRTLEGSRA